MERGWKLRHGGEYGFAVSVDWLAIRLLHGTEESDKVRVDMDVDVD